MADRILRLTERIDYTRIQKDFLLGISRHVTIFPGFVSESSLRDEAGDDLVEMALRLGVLIPQESDG